MKWFKHMTDASRDERLTRLFDAHGHRGVLIYWWILEIVAEQMDDSDKCAAQHTWKHWAKMCRTYAKDMRKIVGTLADLRLIFPTSSADLLTISCPKLLEIRARRKPIGGKKCALDTDTDSRSRRRSRVVTNTSPLSGDVLTVWKAYCSSWDKNGNYKLTPTRRGYIKHALSTYPLDAVLAGVQRFKEDPWADRPRYNDIKYLFGKQERTDKWCNHIEASRPALEAGKRSNAYAQDLARTAIEIANAQENSYGTKKRPHHPPTQPILSVVGDGPDAAEDGAFFDVSH